MSGALARPVGPPPAVAAARAPRLAVAALAALALHAALLALRPGALASSYVAPSSAPVVMAVRVVRAETAAPAPAAASPPPMPAATAEPPPAVVAERALPQRSQRPVDEPRRAPTASREAASSGLAAARPEDGRSTPDATAREPRAAETPLAAAPDYTFGIRLDPGPRPLGEIEPDYPDPVYLREGTVVLRLLISDTGRVDNVAVVRSEPRGVFEEAAIDAFSKARFSPGLAAGIPVKSQIMVEVQFMPINRGARVSGRTY